MLLGGPVIIPEEIAVKYPSKPASEYIGTGPYMFVEWQPNDHITLKRFEGYKALAAPSDGYTGKKSAYLDEIIFYGISEEPVRINGVEGGEYDFADFVPTDEYDRLKDVKNLKTYISPPRAWFVFVLNTKFGPTKNKKVRQAILATIDVESAMAAGYGDSVFWRVDPSLALKEQIWHSTAGESSYNQNNIEKAKQLLKEAGYNGEEISWMSGPLEYNLSAAAKANMVKAGLNINLESMEWATLLSRRKNPELWSMFSSGFTSKADPSLTTAMNLNYGAGWDNPEAEKLYSNFCQEPEFDKRYELLSQFQELVYEEVPYIKVGDYKNLRISSNKVHGFANELYLYFFNVWMEK
jgi:peptide/nickel transport system substrate-binding protein